MTMQTRLMFLCAAIPLGAWQPIAMALGAADTSDSALGAAAIEQATPAQASNPCSAPDIAATPSRPNWNAGAATTQCNVLEFDAGWLIQPMGHHEEQRLFPSSVRYGLTPRMDLRWGLPGPIEQSGSGTNVQDVTDQWISVRYRFLEQERRMPALALSYGIKSPESDPAKGFGTGFVDHQLVLIASRDLGRAHVDFNTVGTIAGGAAGKDGAAQFGLAVSLAVTHQLSWILESDGGPQPGIPDRYGAALMGGSWAFRPWLVFDAAYTQAYTAGAPRAQFTAGLTCARRLPVTLLPSGSRLARWLGR
ncbi:MAG: hypothetical protein WCC26_10650 [Terracidiphilus sp.]